jgi:alkaline phosphatase
MRINKKGFIGGCFIVLVTAFAAGAASSTRMESTPSAAPRPAKYVILMIGDGMGAWHVDAAAKFRGRPPAMTSLEHHGYMTTFMRNATDKSGPYAFEYWDDGSRMGAYDPGQGGHTPWQKPSDPAYPQHNATDSAASATAILSGRKTVRYALNVEAKEQGYAPIGLESIRYHRTIVDIAESLGMATGVVTSVNFNHATPAAAVVKTPYRKNHGEKARQLLESSMEVIMGAGHPMHDNDGTNDAGWNNTLVIVTADHETGYLQPVGDHSGMAVIEHQCWGIDCSGWNEHTNLLVPIFAQGVGAKSLKAAFDGDYRDNTDIFKTMLKALGLKL